MDMIPPSYRPTPRQREHRRLTRQREYVQWLITAVKNRLRRILSDYNADRKDLFTAEGLAYLGRVELAPADRFAADQLCEELSLLRKQLAAADARLRAFAEGAPAAEGERRALLRSIPGVGPVTTEVVLAELADPDRFRSAKGAAAYAGLSPGQRESAGKRRELHISKEGSRHLRWVLVQAAWQLVLRSARWRAVYQALKARVRAKKAVVAVARRLLGLMLAILRSGRPYDPAHAPAA